MSDDEKFDTKGLDQLIKALKGEMQRVRIGILGGGKNVRDDNEVSGGRKVDASSGKKKPKSAFEVSTNAAVGVLHEFGTEKLPMRSFLRIPISDNLQKYLEKQGAFTKGHLTEVVKEGSIVPWLKRIAIVAEGIVAEAFETGGFGKWPAWKTPGYRNKNNRLLDDTGQLKESITSDVK